MKDAQNPPSKRSGSTGKSGKSSTPSPSLTGRGLEGAIGDALSRVPEKVHISLVQNNQRPQPPMQQPPTLNPKSRPLRGRNRSCRLLTRSLPWLHSCLAESCSRPCRSIVGPMLPRQPWLTATSSATC